MNICENNDCTEVTHYEAHIQGDKAPFISKMESENLVNKI